MEISTKDIARVKEVLDKHNVPNPRYMIYNGEFIKLNFFTRMKLFFNRIKPIDFRND